MIEEKNAIIESADIDRERGLCAWLGLDYGGTGQGFGGYILYVPKDWRHHDTAGPNYGGHFIHRLLEVAGVEKWSQLKGKTIRVRAEHSKVHAVGHIVKDDWFNPSEDFEAMQAEWERRFPKGGNDSE